MITKHRDHQLLGHLEDVDVHACEQNPARIRRGLQVQKQKYCRRVLSRACHSFYRYFRRLRFTRRQCSRIMAPEISPLRERALVHESDRRLNLSICLSLDTYECLPASQLYSV